MMTEEQEDKLIEEVCTSFDQLDKSVDTIDGVKRVFNECISVLQSKTLTPCETAEDEDFAEPEDSEVIIFNIEVDVDDDEDGTCELMFTFEYALVSGKYLIFADLDFHNAIDDDSETTDTE